MHGTRPSPSTESRQRAKGTDCPADWRGMNLTAGRRHMRSAHLQRARYDKMRPGSRPERALKPAPAAGAAARLPPGDAAARIP